MLRVLTPRDYHVMPWKNGGGTTTEIWIHPEGAGWDTFEWRVGIADIAGSGPFSSFPGIDRSIMLLDCPEGSGMRLTMDGVEVDLPFREFVDFDGEVTTHGTLLGEPVRDFNVMSRRARVRHRRGYRQLAPDAVLQWPDAEWQFACIVAGSASVATGDRSVCGGGLATGLSAGESLLAQREHRVALRAGSSGCSAIWAAFDAIGAETA